MSATTYPLSLRGSDDDDAPYSVFFVSASLNCESAKITKPVI